MNTYKDTAIVLNRIEYAERDRILTLLTKEHGKITVIAKGVRSANSKLAGGIELFSESQISVINGRGSMGTLISTRLIRHHGEIVKNLDKTNLAYSFLKITQKLLEDGTGQEYYDLLAISLACLGDIGYDHRLVSVWFTMQVLRLSGRQPSLSAKDAESFDFDYDKQQFLSAGSGSFDKNDLKVLRLCGSSSKPPKLQKELGTEAKLSQFALNLLQESIV